MALAPVASIYLRALLQRHSLLLPDRPSQFVRQASLNWGSGQHILHPDGCCGVLRVPRYNYQSRRPNDLVGKDLSSHDGAVRSLDLRVLLLDLRRACHVWLQTLRLVQQMRLWIRPPLQVSEQLHRRLKLRLLLQTNHLGVLDVSESQRD